MLHAYEAIYDHGALCWVSDVPQLKSGEVVVIFKNESMLDEKSPIEDIVAFLRSFSIDVRGYHFDREEANAR